MRKILLILWMALLITCGQEDKTPKTDLTLVLEDDISDIMIPSVSLAEEIVDPDFRQSRWGMSMDQVKAIETATFDYETDKIIVYKTRVADLYMSLGYLFVNDCLYKAKYIVLGPHSNKLEYILEYAKLKLLLSEKHGEPTADKTVWLNDLYLDDQLNWGIALSIGHLKMLANWVKPNVTITILLTGDNQEIDLVIEYLSDSLWAIEREKSHKETMSDL